MAELAKVDNQKLRDYHYMGDLGSALGKLVVSYDKAGRTAEALELQERILTLRLKTNPGDTDASKHLALLRLWLGRGEEHQTLCRQMLLAAKVSTEPTTHDRAAKAYLLQPHPDKELLASAIASANLALALAKASNSDVNLVWLRMLTGFAAYRAGKLSEAEAILTAELKPAIHTNQRELALAFRAMARWQLRRADDARADLQEVEKLNGPKPDQVYVPHPGLNGDRLAVSLALNEARALLKSSP
jgi:tetratricopeptide (TPR) repeat protein